MTIEDQLSEITKAVAKAREEGDNHAYVSFCEACREVHVSSRHTVRCPKDPGVELEIGVYIGRTDVLDELGVMQCVCCGCDDFHACFDDDQPCAWVSWNWETNYGICSACSKKLEAVPA